LTNSAELKETVACNTVDMVFHCQLGVKMDTEISHYFHWRDDVTTDRQSEVHC
jgi:hypothetical protein